MKRIVRTALLSLSATVADTSAQPRSVVFTSWLGSAPNVVAEADPAFASCGVRTSDIAIPTTGTDMQDIVTRYVADPTCNPRLRAVIESIFRDEHRNEEWAGSLERIVKEAALARGAKVAGVCHTSLAATTSS